MARIFLSHSSSDNDLARAMRDWLVGEGWNDLFLDFDPERGIAAGEKWEKALLDAAGRCEAVLFIVTRNWLASGWCLKEFHLAQKLNKRMFMLLVDGLKVPDLPPELTAEWQLVDLEPGADVSTFPVTDGISAEPRLIRFSNVGLRRLRSGLNKAGLDPQFFAWPPAHDPGRPPYRGLKALEADDAGIFFGREAQTVEALDRLRGLRDAAAPRFLAILGASGAGKSSFLRAGLLPRLQRDDRHFCPLPVIRPERAVISGETGLISALVEIFGRVSNGISRKQVEELINLGPQAVVRILTRLSDVMRIPPLPGEPPARPPSLILSIDQGEELFAGDGTEEANRFLDLLAAISVSPDINLIVIVSIRSDSYERLQTAPQLESVRQETLSLPPMPRGAYETVINGPARRLSTAGRSLAVEPALTQQLLADIESGGGKDALPLLAFTLELLYANHGQDGRLTLSDYTALGGIRGSIEVAVERALAAADADPRIPKDRATRLALMRRAFIPWLAGTDLATNTVRRRVARLLDVPEEARPLVECLIGARLLSSDVALDGSVTVEPAHEALLRQWGTLQGWLEEDFAGMAALAGVQRAARDWEANARDPGWLAHAAGRLEDAEASDAKESLAGFLGPRDHEYLTACRLAEDERRNRELEEARKLAASRAQTVRRTRIGLAVASVLFLIAAVIGFYADIKRKDALREEARARAEATRAQASLSVVQSREARTAGNLPTASATALAGYRLLVNAETRSNLLDVGLALDPFLAFSRPLADRYSVTALEWLDESRVAVAGKNERATFLDVMTLREGQQPTLAQGWPVPKVMFDAEDEAEIRAMRSLPDETLLVARNSGTLELYRKGQAAPASWSPPPRQGGNHDFPLAAISQDGRTILLGGSNGVALVACPPLSGAAATLSCALEDLGEGAASAVALSPDGATAYAAFEDGTILTAPANGGRERLRLIEPNLVVRALAPTGRHLAAMVQTTGARAAQGVGLVLLSRIGNSWDTALRAPVSIGTQPRLFWRVQDEELIHNCLSADRKPGPLCATRMISHDPPAWETVRRHSSHRVAADALAVSPNGGALVSRVPTELNIWRWPSERSLHGAPAGAVRGGWASLHPAAEGKYHLTGKDGNGLLLDSARDAEAQTALPTVPGEVVDALPLPGGRAVASETELSFFPEGESAATRTLALPAPVRPRAGLVWTGKGRIVAIALTDWSLALVDLDQESPELIEIAAPDKEFRPFGIIVDQVRGQLIASSAEGSVQAFDLATRAPVRRLANTHAPNGAGILGAEGLAISTDGKLLATTAMHDRVMLYDLERGTSRALIRSRDGAENVDTKSVAFDPAGEILAVIDQANVLSLWNINRSEPELFLRISLPPGNGGGASEPVVSFTVTGGLVVLSNRSDIISISLDETAWQRRIVTLGYDRSTVPAREGAP